MKYPFENTTVWDLIRHPFDEDSGDPGGRTFMRVLSNIFFPIYVFLQVWVPIQFTMHVYESADSVVPQVEQIEQVGQQLVPIWQTVIAVLIVWLLALVGFWTFWVILSVFVRFGTSTYFHKLLIAFFYAVLCLCTKKGTPQNIKWTERLDEAITNIDIVKAEMAGKELSLADIINPSMDVDLVESSISSYMKSLNGKYNGNNIAKLFVTLCKTKVLATDTLAHFYRVMSSQYTDGKWVTPNVVQKYARELNALEDSKRGWQKEIMQKYFPQINLDELNTDNA